MTRSPRDSRRLYPDPTGAQAPVGPLRVYFLEVSGSTPARRDYEQYDQKPRVIAALTAIDVLLADGVVVPPGRMESFTHRHVKLYEIKAPHRGERIFRLLAYRESDWNLFVAVAREKKSQALPDAWKDLASQRVKAALEEGGRPL